jgi:hypothetical protein
MIIANTKIEETLKDLLQKDLKLMINNKQYRRGKLLLFKQSNYFIEFTILKNVEDIKRFEIPIPFGIEKWDKEGLVYFDYRLKTLAKSNTVVYEMLKKLPAEGNNKFYNNILEFQVQ